MRVSQWLSVYGSDKVSTHNYGSFYDELFARLRPQAVLEIGVYRGASLRAWQAAGVPNVMGVDKDVTQNRSGPAVLYGTMPDDARTIARLVPALDLIIDDGTPRAAFLVTGSTSTISNIINAGPYGLYNLTSSQCSDGSAGSVNFPANGGKIAVLVTFNTAGTNTSAFSRTAAYTYVIDNCQRYNDLRVFFRNMYMMGLVRIPLAT